MKYVVFMCHTIKILVSNWPRTRKFSQLITGKEDSCSWLFSPWWHVGHALRPIFMVWLVKICQNEIHLLSRSPLLFMASLFIGFLVEKYVACQSRKSHFGWHRFHFHLGWCVRGLQSLRRYWPYLIPFRSCISNGNVFDVCFLYLI